jgi:non-lysosomal glucosylceramidase
LTQFIKHELIFLFAILFADGSPPEHSLVSIVKRKFSLDRSRSGLKDIIDVYHQNDTAADILERMTSKLEQIHTRNSSNSALGTNLLQKGEENIGQFLYLEGIEYQMWNTSDVHFCSSYALVCYFQNSNLASKETLQRQ